MSAPPPQSLVDPMKLLLVHAGDPSPAQEGDDWGVGVDADAFAAEVLAQLGMLAQGLERDIASDKLVDYVVNCASQLSPKTPTYGTLVGLLNAKEPSFGLRVLGRAMPELRLAVATLSQKPTSPLRARLLLRFVAELCNARVVRVTALLKLLTALLDASRLAFSRAGGAGDGEAAAADWSVPRCDADMLLLIVMSTLPWAARLAEPATAAEGATVEAPPERPLEALLDLVSACMAARRADTAVLSPFPVLSTTRDDDQKDEVDTLWGWLSSMREAGATASAVAWSPALVATPWQSESIAEQLAGAHEHELPAVGVGSDAGSGTGSAGDTDAAGAVGGADDAASASMDTEGAASGADGIADAAVDAGDTASADTAADTALATVAVTATDSAAATAAVTTDTAQQSALPQTRSNGTGGRYRQTLPATLEIFATDDGSGALPPKAEALASLPAGDRWVWRQLVADVLESFAPKHTLAAQHIWRLSAVVPLGEDVSRELLVLDGLFCWMLRQPGAASRTAPCPSLGPMMAQCVLLDLMQASKGFAGALAFVVEMLYRRAAGLDAGALDALASCLSHFLSNFDFKWPWGRWAAAVDLPPDDARRCFVTAVLRRCIQLSDHGIMHNVLPDEVQPLLPPKPQPYCKYLDEDLVSREKAAADERGEQSTAVAGNELVKALADMLRAPGIGGSAESGEVMQWAQEKLGDDCGGEFRVEVIMHALLHVGEMSYSTIFGLLVTFQPLFAWARETARSQPTIISTVVEVWASAPGVVLVLLDKFLRTRLVSPASIVQWVLADGTDDSWGR
eukprot:g286.t1